MADGNITQAEANVRITAYVPSSVARSARQFIAADENADQYSKGKMSLLTTNALKFHLGFPVPDSSGKYSFKCGKCYVNIRETDKFCFECGASAKGRITVS